MIISLNKDSSSTRKNDWSTTGFGLNNIVNSNKPNLEKLLLFLIMRSNFIYHRTIKDNTKDIIKDNSKDNFKDNFKNIIKDSIEVT